MGISVPRQGRPIAAVKRFQALEAWETPKSFAVAAAQGPATATLRGLLASKPLEDKLGFAETVETSRILQLETVIKHKDPCLPRHEKPGKQSCTSRIWP